MYQEGKSRGPTIARSRKFCGNTEAEENTQHSAKLRRSNEGKNKKKDRPGSSLANTKTKEKTLDDLQIRRRKAAPVTEEVKKTEVDLDDTEDELLLTYRGWDWEPQSS